MPALLCMKERDWDRDRKTAVAFTGAAELYLPPVLTAGEHDK